LHDRATDRIALASAAILDGNDLLAVDARHVAAREAHQRPADGLICLSKMQQVLFGLIRVVPNALGARRGRAHRGTCHLCAHEALNRMEPRAGSSPFVLAVPRESRAER